MEFTQLFDNDDAVSPVIGVILMVAITVILAAVIGTFVLGLGDQVSNTSPQASFTFDFNENGNAGDCTLTQSGNGDGELTVTHDGGDKIDASQVTITDGSTTGDWNTGSAAKDCTGDTPVSAGASALVGTSSDQTIRVIWQSSNGGDTATLGKWTGPNA